MPEFHSPKHGDWFWHELTTTDTDAAKRFYGAVLGWTTEDMDMGGYSYPLIKHPSGTNLGGMMPMEDPGWDDFKPQWMLYVAVRDVEQTKADVEAAGGTVVAGPDTAPGVGRFIVIRDPQGAVLTLMQPAPEMGGPG